MAGLGLFTVPGLSTSERSRVFFNVEDRAKKTDTCVKNIID